MRVTQVAGGFVIHGDCTDEDVQEFVVKTCGPLILVIADPPYGKVVSDEWDQVDATDVEYATSMVAWTREWASLCVRGAAFYVWGGAGQPGFRR